MTRKMISWLRIAGILRRMAGKMTSGLEFVGILRVLRILGAVICAVCLWAGCAEAGLEIHYVDVGQGDCTIVLADGQAMIIDGGSAWQSSRVYSYITKTLGLEKIDIMVATHPHEDHIGGLPAALKAVPVDLILSPVTEWDTEEFRNLLTYADIRESRIEIPYDQEQFRLGGAVVTCEICWPEAEYYSGVNDMSIVTRVDYGKTSFLFTGDAESTLEYVMVDAGIRPADVLKIGHHGSSSSSTMEFLEAVRPRWSVISCGKGNGYGHPHQETLDRLKAMDVHVFRTDLQGHIICHSDGKTIRFETEKAAAAEELFEAPDLEAGLPEGKYYASRRTMKYHLPSCRWAMAISENNLVVFDTKEEAEAAEFTACGVCRP